MIVFKKLRWKNFLATGNNFNEIQLNQHPSLLVTGVNGSGKSTWICALTFALFGKSFRKINKPNLVNSVNKRDCVVELEFSIGKIDWLVRRGISPGIFEIYRDSVLVDQQAHKLDQQDWLERNVIKMNFTTFCQIVVLGSANYTPFLHLSAGQRREVVESILDINVFSSMNQILKEKINEWQSGIDALKTESRMISSKIDVHMHYVENQKKNKDELIKKEFALLEETKADLISKNLKKQEINSQIETLSNTLTILPDVTNDLLKVKMDLTFKKKEIDSQKAKIGFFEQNEICPECVQPIGDDHKKKIITNLLQELSKHDADMAEQIAQYQKTESRYNELVKESEALNDKRKSLDELSYEMKSLMTIAKNVSDKIKELGQAQNEVSNEEIDKLQVRLQSIQDMIEEMTKSGESFDVAQKLLRDNGIKSVIIRQYIPIINSCINKFLSLFDFYIKFELDESFNETIYTGGREGFAYNNFSQGERARVDIAILMAWREVARMRAQVNCNLLIFDEVFDSSMDAKGADDLMTIVNSLGDKTNVIIISHRGDQLLDKLSAHIKFQKHNGYSMISENE